MKIVKTIALFILLLVGLSICGTLVLYIKCLLFDCTFDNIIYSGFKIGFVATVIVLANWTYKKMKK